ncbi:MAG: alpha/beta hydrolase [Actinomycetota bacterium]|nr:alpha/beta hydrolase [Actinomycetota bacterium]MDA3028601.1 alpha/beta hydrolase [Actinomycetota bacterium]
MNNINVDPELREALKTLPTVIDFGHPGDMPALRARMNELYTSGQDRGDVVREDVTIPGRDGGADVHARLYRPSAPQASPLPGVVELHGGGFIFGHVDMMDPWCDVVASGLSAVVISVDYRLAPEHPYPGALDDCYAALCWFSNNAVRLGVDPARIAIAGQSAGGGLAAATALLARDHGGPAICFQLLESPQLDDRLGTPSMTEYLATPNWNRPNALTSWTWYLGNDLRPGADDIPIYAAPSRADDLSGLPAAYVSVMEFDPLRDEGIDYASRLLQHGVQTELHAFPGTFHGSSVIRSAAMSRRISREAIAALERGIRR